MDKPKRQIFVFGSNTAGIHGAGAALYALKYHGALMGCGYGHMGNSFAIPTKGGTNFIGRSLKVDQIKGFVDGFLTYAAHRPDLIFNVTRIGCGLAGHKDADIAPLFQVATRHTYRNVYLDTVWKEHLDDPHEVNYNYWGTY